MGWEKITLHGAGWVAMSMAAVQDAFIEAWSPAGTPPSAVLYSTRTMLREPGSCEIYLSPLAAEIARLTLAPFHPVPVDPPDLNDLEVSVFNCACQPRGLSPNVRTA